MRTIFLILSALALLLGCTMLWAYREARMDPIVRQTTVAMPDWPKGAPPLHVALLSDVHAGTAAVDPVRLGRIVDQVNALKPDLIVMAGDFLPGHDAIPADQAATVLAPLAKLHAPMGVVAVPGNHDHWTGLPGVDATLRAQGVTVLENQAIQLGPLAIGGIDDDFSGHAEVAATLAATRKLSGARLLLTHSPDIAADLPADFPLLLAGHTHCGQVLLPLIGPVSDVSRYHARYRCGLVREGGRTVIVTGGVGTSGGPFRLNAPPDMWLITLGPR